MTNVSSIAIAIELKSSRGTFSLIAIELKNDGQRALKRSLSQAHKYQRGQRALILVFALLATASKTYIGSVLFRTSAYTYL